MQKTDKRQLFLITLHVMKDVRPACERLHNQRNDGVNIMAFSLTYY